MLMTDPCSPPFYRINLEHHLLSTAIPLDPHRFTPVH